MKKLAALTLLALLLSLLAAVPAEAGGPPEKGEKSGEEDSFVVDCAPYGYQFELWDHATWHLFYTFIGKGDVYWMSEEHGAGVDNVYNKSYPERMVTGPFIVDNHIEEYSGPLCPTTWPCMIRDVTGVFWHIRLPDGKLVLRAAGLSNDVRYWPEGPYTGPEVYLVEVRRAGLAKADFAAMCAALAP